MNASARRTASALKKATNISLSVDLIAEAKALGINISQACERGLAAELAEVRSTRWRAENAKAIGAWNDFVEQEGLPLARHRQF
ncbi:type II toxin-antitoxin system CcdA family antitoxin [Sphingosinicella microcystinivorans]|uniref:type II toxin-antitoxin system CcdA family antitoxin n=1 Tax=Sphingosinicella microcystinivorans TaxID=335406 RepID=UPI0022F38CE0|nr:type II toxin-antitoxin system CcdA family antitoxin [Sphingosinicella microcystinivorans]WBX86517.1 type II toxin-antitoxin system CcdA family antitoxin [Sphingosinicella microcystinivorans]